MLRLKRITRVLVLVSVLAVALSCSENDEVLEQQEPQSQISASLAQRLAATAGSANQEAIKFFEDINWYKNLNFYCGVDAAVLAYELFDDNNNSLDTIDILAWTVNSGLTIEDVTLQAETIAEQQFGMNVQLIFVAGVLIKPIDANSYEAAEISSFDTFNDYFKDCQSDDVVFSVYQGVYDFNVLPPPVNNANAVTFPSSGVACAYLDFPVDILTAATNNPTSTLQITVDELSFLDYLLGNVPGLVLIDFVYPVTVNLADGSTLAANNATELEVIFDQNCN